MIFSEIHDLFREATSPDIELERLHEIVSLGDETLSAAVALNLNCDKKLLDKLSALEMNEVHENLSIRYTTYPPGRVSGNCVV